MLLSPEAEVVGKAGTMKSARAWAQILALGLSMLSGPGEAAHVMDGPQFPQLSNGDSNACLTELCEGMPTLQCRAVWQSRRGGGVTE